MAIGNRATDINMILDSDVGISLNDQKCRLVVSTSDIQINKFKTIKNLLFKLGPEV